MKYSEFSKIMYKSKSAEAEKDADIATKDEINGCGYKNKFGLHGFTVNTNNVGAECCKWHFKFTKVGARIQKVFVISLIGIQKVFVISLFR